MIADIGGIDALAFTGSIGKNDANIRATLLEGLARTGLVMDAAAHQKGEARVQQDHSPVNASIVPTPKERDSVTAALAVIA